MKTIYPNKLKSGDTVQIIAPSSSISTLKKTFQNTAKKVFEKELGLKVVFSKNAFEKNMLGSSSLKSRIDDLNDAFSDKKVNAILCARGGFNANTLLKYIDWGNIQVNPKPLCGFSDITVLANAIYAKTGVVSYLGPNFASFSAKEGVSYVVEYFKKCLINKDPFEIFPSKMAGEKTISFKKNKGLEVLQEGEAEGILIGGHLSTLNLLQGTEFMPSLKNTIVFIETDDFGNEKAFVEFERDLQSLLHLPDAKFIKGIVFGRFQKASTITIKKLEFIISSKSELQNIPIIANADFGHTQPIATLPIGGTVKIEAQKNNTRITILKH